MNTSGYALTVAIGWGAALVAAGECTAGGYTVEAWYPFTGGTADDATGNGNHGVIVGSPGVEPGIVGHALRFDGVSDYVFVPHDPAFMTDSASVSVWLKVDTLPTSNATLIKKRTGLTGYDLWVDGETGGLSTGNGIEIHGYWGRASDRIDRPEARARAEPPGAQVLEEEKKRKRFSDNENVEAAHAAMTEISEEAAAEYRRVIGILGEEIDLNAITQKIRKRFPMADAVSSGLDPVQMNESQIIRELRTMGYEIIAPAGGPYSVKDFSGGRITRPFDLYELQGFLKENRCQ